MSNEDEIHDSETTKFNDTTELQGIADTNKGDSLADIQVESEPHGPKLEYNPLIDEAIERKNSGEEGFEWLDTKIHEEDRYSVLLDIIEASTAEEVYFHDRQKNPTTDLRVIREGAIKKLMDLAELADVDPKQVATEIGIRAFRSNADRESLGRPTYANFKGERYFVDSWGYYSRRQYSDEYHRNYIGQIGRHLKSEVQPEYRGADNLTIAAALQRHGEGKEKLSMATRVYFAYKEEREGELEISLKQILDTKIGDPEELALAIATIEELHNGDIPTREGLKWLQGGLNMVRKFIKHCDALGIGNAQLIANMLTQADVAQGRRSNNAIGIRDIVSIANGLRKQLGQESIIDNNNDLDIQIPEAVDTITDVILNYGQNSLSDEEKDTLITYTKTASDLFVIGKYLRDERYKTQTIEEYLDAHPRLSGARLDKLLNPEPHSPAETRRGINANRQEFGSVVYWKARKAGYGKLS